MKAFVEKQIDELIENGPVIVQATAGLVGGCTVIVVLALTAGLLAYAVAMLVTAVVGLGFFLFPRFRPLGKGLMGAASVTVSLLPVMIFGAVFRSLG